MATLHFTLLTLHNFLILQQLLELLL